MPADAHDARPYSCLRHPPQQPNIRSLDFGKGVLGKTVLMMLFGGGLGHWKSSPVVGICCENVSPEAERPRERPGRNGGPMKRGRRHGRLPHSRARAVAGGSNVGRCPILRASGSGRRPQRRMARLQISGHHAYPAVRSDLTPAPHFCPRATAAGSLH